MNVNAFLQKDYENEPPSGPKKTNPNKPNFKPDARLGLAMTFFSSESFGGFHFECRNGKIAQKTVISGLFLSQVEYVPA